MDQHRKHNEITRIFVRLQLIGSIVGSSDYFVSHTTKRFVSVIRTPLIPEFHPGGYPIVPSWELTYPTLGKGAFGWDILVPRRVAVFKKKRLIFSFTTLHAIRSRTRVWCVSIGRMAPKATYSPRSYVAAPWFFGIGRGIVTGWWQPKNHATKKHKN